MVLVVKGLLCESNMILLVLCSWQIMIAMLVAAEVASSLSLALATVFTPGVAKVGV